MEQPITCFRVLHGLVMATEKGGGADRQCYSHCNFLIRIELISEGRLGQYAEAVTFCIFIVSCVCVF